MVHALEDTHACESVGILQQHLLEHNLPRGGLHQQRGQQHKREHGEGQQLEQHHPAAGLLVGVAHPQETVEGHGGQHEGGQGAAHVLQGTIQFAQGRAEHPEAEQLEICEII